MPARTPSAQTIRNIITLRALTRLSYRQLSRLSDVPKTTVGKYLSAFERSSLSLAKARRLSDKELNALLSPTSVRQRSRRHRTLIGLLPVIHQRLSDPTTSLLDQWKLYKRQYPQGLGYSRVAQLYAEWLSTNSLPKWPRHRWAVPIVNDNFKVLRKWRSARPETSGSSIGG